MDREIAKNVVPDQRAVRSRLLSCGSGGACVRVLSEGMDVARERLS